MSQEFDAIVAGHICLDIVPALGAGQTTAERIFAPGQLFRVGPAKVVLGGCVANTGIALHRLGARVALNAKVGDDVLGNALLKILQDVDQTMVSAMVTAVGEATSYSIVISPAGIDRGFLHCSGVNDTFSAADINTKLIASSKLLHFGYPPLMRLTLADGGVSLAQKFRDIQDRGSLVSLDLAMPPSESPECMIDWKGWLQTVLPAVDIFAPSIDEILQMLRPEFYTALCRSNHIENIAHALDINQLDDLAGELLDYGPSIVLIKLGDRGLYLATSDGISAKLSERRFWKNHDWNLWTGIRVLEQCYDVEIVGTTGAGDCTIAGFLMGILKGLGPRQAVQMATAVGACSVQSLDATSNIPRWDNVVSKSGQMKKREIPVTCPSRTDGLVIHRI